MNDEIKRYAKSVTNQPSRAARNAALERVPSHIRGKVRAYVSAEWKKRKGKM